MAKMKSVVQVAALGLALSPLAAPAARADVVGAQQHRSCADAGQPGLTGFVVEEPTPVPGGRAANLRFRATFNRVVARGEGVCLKLTLGGAGLRALVGGSAVAPVNGLPSLTLAIGGDGTNSIGFSSGQAIRWFGAAIPPFRTVGTTLMAAPGVGNVSVEQINADGGGLGGGVRNVQVQVAATPRPVISVTRPTILAGQVGEGTVRFVNFELARGLTIQELVSDTAVGRDLALRPVAGGAYGSTFVYRVEGGSQVDGRFYYKAGSAVPQSRIANFELNDTVLAAPRVTLNPVPDCGSKPQIFRPQPDGTLVADCKKLQIQPLPLNN